MSSVQSALRISTWRTIKKIGHGLARAGDHGIGAATGGEGSASIGIIVQQIILYRVDDLLGNLRACRAVEKSSGVLVHLGPQGRKLLPHPGEVQGSASGGGCNG